MVKVKWAEPDQGHMPGQLVNNYSNDMSKVIGRCLVRIAQAEQVCMT